MPTEIHFQAGSVQGGGAVGVRRRSAIVIGSLWLLGALPAILNWAFQVQVPPFLEVLGWGLWIPGAGFIAVGGWSALWAILIIVLFLAAFFAWALCGMLAAPLLVWLGAALAAALIAPDVTNWQANLIVPMAACALVVWRVMANRKQFKAAATRGTARSARIPQLVAALNKLAEQAPNPKELDPQQIAAVRYIIELTRQPVGSLDGFTKLDNFQTAALRYQLTAINYALACLQIRYTPNFHGYLNKAQRFAIESLTDPKVCGYWKWEKLWGRFRWNYNPIDIDNVMLTGFAQIGIAAYTATTGDQRYQAKGALPFKPSRSSDQTYNHDTHSLTESITRNWDLSPVTLYPCEPYWVFPICNAAAFSGVSAYDRANGTQYAEKHRKKFVEHLKADFMLPDGSVRSVLNTLTGWTWLSGVIPTQMQAVFFMQFSRMTSSVDKNLSRQWYLIARDEFFDIDDNGRVQLIGFDWSTLVDGGHYRKGPGEFMANIALAAIEHGDTEMAGAMLREIDVRLTKQDKPGVLAYQDTSAGTNVLLATARFVQRDDWRAMIEVGPEPSTFDGPLLTQCSYPEVLVAAAHGDALGLNLVLYNGFEPGVQSIQIERLKANSIYRIEGASKSSITLADDQTTASLQVMIDGRTEVTLRLED